MDPPSEDSDSSVSSLCSYKTVTGQFYLATVDVPVSVPPPPDPLGSYSSLSTPIPRAEEEEEEHEAQNDVLKKPQQQLGSYKSFESSSSACSTGGTTSPLMAAYSDSNLAATKQPIYVTEPNLAVANDESKPTEESLLQSYGSNVPMEKRSAAPSASAVEKPKVQKEEKKKKKTEQVDPPLKPAVQRLQVRDWNAEFQALVTNTNSLEERAPELAALAHDFVQTAELYGKIIISELHVPKEDKTIKVQDIGGIAGGQKFICGGIFFKFAQDEGFDTPNGKVWLYGDTKRSVEKASKAASHELKGMCAFFNQATALKLPICVPLLALIDYRGYRLLGSCLLPISKNTLQLGSNDGGVSFKNDNPQLTAWTNQICQSMNLAMHISGADGTVVCGPGDLEVHKGRDNRFYVLDFARLLPPEAPRANENGKKNMRAIYYNLLRLEFLRRKEMPALSSDSFSGWSKHDPHQKEHNRRVEEASELLRTIVVKEYAKELSKMKSFANYDLSTEVHRRGINLRLLGLVRSNVESSNADCLKVILTEMVLRVCRKSLERRLRKKMDQLKLPHDYPYKQCILEFFNLLLGNTAESRPFWCSQLKKKLTKKYEVGLTARETDSPFDLSSAIDLPTLITRLAKLGGIVLSERFLQLGQLKSSTKPFPGVLKQFVAKLLPPDILATNCVVKHMNIVDFYDGCALQQSAAEMGLEMNIVEAKGMYEYAASKFAVAWKSNSTNGIIPAKIASCEFEASVVSDSSVEGFNISLTVIQKSQQLYEIALQLSPDVGSIHYDYARLQCFIAMKGTKPSTVVKAIETLRKAFQLDLSLINRAYSDALRFQANAYIQRMVIFRAVAETDSPFANRARSAAAMLLLKCLQTQNLRTIALAVGIDDQAVASNEAPKMAAELMAKVIESDLNAAQEWLEEAIERAAIKEWILFQVATHSPSFASILYKRWSQQRSINLKGEWTHEFLVQFLKWIPPMKEFSFELSGTCNTCTFDTMRELIAAHPEVESLHIRRCASMILSRHTEEMFQRMTSLTALNFAGSVGGQGDDLPPNLGKHQRLRKLSIGGLNTTTARLTAVLRNCRDSLEHLETSTFGMISEEVVPDEMGNTDLPPKPEGTDERGTFETHRIETFEVVASCPHLTSLIWNHWPIDRPSDVLKLLTGEKKLKRLELHTSWEENVSFEEAFGELSQLQDLEWLSLPRSRNNLAIAMQSLTRCPRLRSLSLEGCIALNDETLMGIAAISGLTQLKIHHVSGFSEQGMGCLAALTGLRSLRFDTVNQEAFVDIGLRAAMSGFSLLEELDLHSNRFIALTDDTIVLIARQNTLLTHLEVLNAKGVGHVSAVSIGRHLTKLRRLLLTNSNLADPAIPYLTSLHALRTLSLSHSKNLSDDCFTHIAKLSNLEELDLSFSAIKGSGLAQLGAGCPKLRTLNLEGGYLDRRSYVVHLLSYYPSGTLKLSALYSQ